jgi:hypothetical protein
VAEGVVDDISHEGLRALLPEEDVSCQAVKTFKASTDPDYQAKGRPGSGVSTRSPTPRPSPAPATRELGHHATGATRPMLIAMWLAAPWRGATRLLFRLGSALSGRPSRRGLAMVGLSGVVIAVVQAVHQGHWLAGGVVAAVALWSVVCPLADAWVCRRAEFAADRFAADRGLAIELTAALGALHGPSSSTSGWPRRLPATHSTTEERISALLAVRLVRAKSAAVRPLSRLAQRR